VEEVSVMKDEDKPKGQRRGKQEASEMKYELMLDKAQKQNEFLKTILDSIPHAIYVIDAKDFTIKLANQPGRRGSLAENATCYSYIHNNSKPCESRDYVCPLEQVKKTKKPVIVEQTHYDEVGNPKSIEVQSFPIFDTEGNVIQVIECFLDITECKRAEKALRESEEKFYKAFYRNPGTSIITTLKDGKIVDVNEGFCLATGYTREEAIGHTSVKLGILSAEDRRQIMERIIEHGAVSNLLVEFHTKTKEARLALYSAERFSIGDEQFLIVLANDITEGKRAAEALQQSENRYRELADSLPQIIFELDNRGYFTFANRNAFQATGYTQEDLDTGLHALQVFVPEDRERVQRNIQRVLSGEELEGNEYTALRKDGSTFPVVIFSKPIVQGSKTVGLRGIVIDTTEHKLTKRKSTG
jgi:PAS domain S-box-containing protein